MITEKDADEIRKGPKDPAKPTIGPSRWMYWNVHLDGLERTHDLIVEREGVFKECILAIKMAKLLGYQVATNTTIYKETDMEEIEQMFDFLSDLGVDGHTISPGYEYDAAKKDMVKRLNLQPENFFLTRKMTVEKFEKIEEWMGKYTLFGTPVYFEFLAGKRDLTCSAWAIPTRNMRGWKGPCYFMTDGALRIRVTRSCWRKWSGTNTASSTASRAIRRCENCMVHCGYEPTASLGLNAQRGDTWKNVKFNFGCEAEANRPGQRDRGLQRRDFRQRSSHGQTRRSRGASILDANASVTREPHRAAERSPDAAQLDIRQTMRRSRARLRARRRICCGNSSRTAIGAASCWSIARFAPISSSSCIGWAKWTTRSSSAAFATF